jgi:LmbE family N-acetylglucosaminyl deacetylase
MPIERKRAQPAPALARSRVLFVFAHQDDEFGVYGYIAREVARGAQVQCAYLTDGGWGNQDIGVRNAESLAVLADRGVAPEAVALVGQAASIGDGTRIGVSTTPGEVSMRCC